MPIKPENRKLYPKNWPEIRAEVLERDGHKCKQCGVPDNALITRVRNNGKWWLRMGDESEECIRVVLTTAHLDHDPTNNGTPGNRPNLVALCQKCHNGHDAKMRAGHARQTRRSKVAVKELF